MSAKVKRGLILFSVLSLITLALVFINQRTNAATIPDTPEVRDVLATVERAYEVLAIPFERLNLKQLDEVFVNDPVFANQLSAGELHELQQYTRKIQGDKALEDFGYLTSMRTKRLNQQHGAQLLRAAQAKAKAENRAISEAEMQQLTEQNYGMQPYAPESAASDQDASFKRVLTYYFVQITGDTAEVKFDDMVKNLRAILVRRDGRWYVAGIY